MPEAFFSIFTALFHHDTHGEEEMEQGNLVVTGGHGLLQNTILFHFLWRKQALTFAWFFCLHIYGTMNSVYCKNIWIEGAQIIKVKLLLENNCVPLTFLQSLEVQSVPTLNNSGFRDAVWVLWRRSACVPFVQLVKLKRPFEFHRADWTTGARLGVFVLDALCVCPAGRFPAGGPRHCEPSFCRTAKREYLLNFIARLSDLI